MLLKPIYRAELLQTKEYIQEEHRNNNINKIVSNIYDKVIYTSQTTTDTVFQFRINEDSVIPREFYISNINNIISSLQKAFPDCSVRHDILVRGIDGKMYDLSKLVHKDLQYITRATDDSYIVVDWS